MRGLAKNVLTRMTYQWPLKLTALVVAGALWVYVLNQQDPVEERRVDISVTAVNTPKGQQAVEVRPNRVRVTIRGRRSQLEQASTTMHAAVDLSGLDQGEQQIPVEIMGVPPGVELLQVNEQYASVKLEPAISKTLSIQVEVEGIPAEKYQASAPSVSPRKVTVTGPASAVRKVVRVVAVVDVTERSESFTEIVQLEARDKTGLPVSNVSIEPQEAEVTVPIRRVSAKAVPVWPDLSDPAPGYRVERLAVRPPVVTVSARPEVLDGIRWIRTERIEIGEVRRSATFSVRLLVPRAGVTLGRATAQVTVTVARLPGASREEAPAGPEGQGPGAGEAETEPGPSAGGPAPENAPAAGPGPSAAEGEPPAPMATSRPSDARP